MFSVFIIIAHLQSGAVYFVYCDPDAEKAMGISPSIQPEQWQWAQLAWFVCIVACCRRQVSSQTTATWTKATWTIALLDDCANSDNCHHEK